MAALSEEERIYLLMIRGWGDRQRSLTEVRTIFNNEFRDENNHVSKSTVSRTISRFGATGGVKSQKRSGRPATATNEEVQLRVAEAFVENPHCSIRGAGQQLDMSFKSVHRCLKKINFHPYKIHLHQELNEDDPDRRIEFSEIMMDRIMENPSFLYSIVFSDEATFMLNGEVNRHNFRYWSAENPHWLREHKTQYPEKLNVWAGILNDTIIGPFFIQGNLTAEKYVNMLQNEIVPAIREKVGDDFERTWFQQDGAAPHYGRGVRNYLNEIFLNRWIGRRGPIDWPARSPDLTPLDYFLWGYLKGKVYGTKPNNLEELMQRIRDESNGLNGEVIKSAVDNFYIRLGYCQEVQGYNFEHLVK